MTEQPRPEPQTPVDPPPVDPPPADQAYAPPPAGWAVPQVKPVTDGTAVLALVFAVLSWLLLPVVLAVVALVLARSAERQIQASQGTRSGQGLVTASRWIAWINLLLAAMVVAFVAAFVVALAIAN